MILIYMVFYSYMLYTYLLTIYIIMYEVMYDISLILIWIDFDNHMHLILQKSVFEL